jgi:hypothetical protein
LPIGFTGGLSYTWRDWTFHYRLGYQTFELGVNGQHIFPERSLYIDSGATNNEKVNSASRSEFRRLEAPISEFSYTGRLNKRVDLRRAYIFYRYRGPFAMDAAFDGNARTNFSGTAVAPYSVGWDAHARLTEPNHVIDDGFSLKIKEWWNLHADYRYSRFTLDSLAHYHSMRDVTSTAEGDVENQWLFGTHLLDVNMEFLASRSLVVRPGIKFLKRDVEVLEEGESDPVRSKRTKTVWPTLSVFYQPSKHFCVRGDFQSITKGTSYTRITPHTDVGSHQFEEEAADLNGSVPGFE